MSFGVRIVGLLEFQPVLVYSLGLEDFDLVFELFEVVGVLVEEVAVEKGCWVVDFGRCADELWVYAVELVDCLLFLERRVEFLEFFTVTWWVALRILLSKPLVCGLLIPVDLRTSFLFIASFRHRLLFVPMKRIFPLVLFPFLQPKHHLIKLFQVHLITLKILNISIGLILTQPHRRRTPTHHINRLWRLQLILELTIEVSFVHVLGWDGGAGFGQF